MAELTPGLEQLTQLRILGRDLTRELPPGLEMVAASGHLQEEAAGEDADLLAGSIITVLKLLLLLSDFDSTALGKHRDFARPLVSFAQGLGCHPVASLIQVLLNLGQRPLGVGEFFPKPMLALILGLESREGIDVLSSVWLGQGLDRLPQQLPCPGSSDVSGKDKQELRVPIESLGELYEGLRSGSLDLASLDSADLRSRETAPPCQSPHG